jgi:concanavalin A-like lectin/glucanase superfamily protein/glycine rich protein
MPSKPPSPRLAKTTALSKAQATVTRLATLVPAMATTLSPVNVYQPGGTVGGQLSTPTSIPGGPGTVNMDVFYGVWVAPDLLGTGAPYTVQVECFGAGGGGGGGSGASGGGGGGGGEYACETQYPITPGNSYAYAVGLPGSNGVNNSTSASPGSAGSSGGQTIFDIGGLGLAHGVVANGGLGGDVTAVGIGGAGGSGSPNSIHFPGGAGGSNNSVNGADNPISFSGNATDYFTLGQGNLQSWYILNDASSAGGNVNDDSYNGYTGVITDYSGAGLALKAAAAPTQAPSTVTSFGLPNPQAASVAPHWKLGSLTSPSAKIKTGSFPFSGANLTVSCWIQCDPSGTWGNTATSSYSVIAANCQNYNGNSMTGYALFLVQQGPQQIQNWDLYGAVGNGTSRTLVGFGLGSPVPGAWYYVVMTYNAGTLSLYVNGVLESTTTSSGYTSVPSGAFPTVIGMDPNATANWFFGYMSNVWFAEDTANTTLIAQAYGLTPATGGAGGGASGGPGGAGGTGASGTGATGGAGGTAVAQPASLAATTTPAMTGFAGANGGISDLYPPIPSGGVYGGGGGGDGNMSGSPALTVLTVPFASALTYYGVDAASGGGSPYNTAQQSNPNSAVNSVLYAGGAPGDVATGSKISVLLLPKGLAASLGGSGWTISQVFLTFTNAYPGNPQESLLEVGYTNDTSLPQTYTAQYTGNNIAAVPIPSGAGTITFDITASGIVGNQASLGGLQEGTITAFIIGPANTPVIDAYNAPTGPDFYCSIYGPGAADAFGNSQAPYLTLVLVKIPMAPVGSDGAGGGILVTAVNAAHAPVGTVQAYATTDSGGNQLAAGFTAFPAAGGGYALQTSGQYSPGGLTGVGTAAATAQVGSGTATSGDAAAAIVVKSQSAAGTGASVGAVTSGGFSGAMPVVQTALATFTAGASAGAQQFTTSYTIPAGDAKAGTIYELWFPFNGTFETGTGSFGLGFKPNLNGNTLTTSLGDETGISAFGAGAGIAGQIRITCVVKTTGVSGTADFYLDGGVGVNAVRSTGTNNNDIYFSSQSTGQTFNTTAPNTIEGIAIWGAVVTGETVTSTISTFTRKGP